MPAIDECEPQVIRALEKAEWRLESHPFAIRVGTGRRSYLYADLRLSKAEDNHVIIVTEVKCFTGSQPSMVEFYEAIGQYVVYRTALLMNRIDATLYLAIPENVYSGFFQTDLVTEVFQTLRIKLIVVNLRREEVVAWIN